MATTFGARLKHAWNAFKRDPTDIDRSTYQDRGQSFLYRPDRLHLTRGPDKTIIASIYNRISMDVSSVKIEHVRLDDENRYIATIKSPLNNCLTLEANIDQTGRTFIQDAVLTMLDSGCVALVPTETDIDPTKSDSPTFDIYSMRTGTITQWFPRHVQVDIYNEVTGQHSQYILPKAMLAIVENPFYPVMNEPNSTMQRLIRKLTILDAIDEQTGSGKLDMIIQLPYIIKTEERRKQAENRRKELERQLAESKYGVAYADGTEKIVQLNKPLENNLLSTIEYLTSMLYSQLGITTGILDGTADEQTMLNYNNRIIEPILSALTDEMKRKFLTKTARSQHQSIKFFREAFKLTPTSNLAELADKFTRNEIMTANEFRQVLGMKPAEDPAADELRNKNMPLEDQPQGAEMAENGEIPAEEGGEEIDVATGADNIDAGLDELEELLNHSALKHYLPTPATYASKYYDPEKAHEYYMKNRELQERKSTKQLNEKGHEVADYVKSQIDTEKQKALAEHDTRTAAQLQSLKDQKTSYTEANSANTQAKIKAAQNAKNTQVDTINSQASAATKTAQSQRDAAIKQRQTQMQSQIDTWRARLNAMTPAQKEKNRNKIQLIIDGLREDNANDRAQIEGEYSQTSEKIKEASSRGKAQANEKYQSSAESTRETGKAIQNVINSNYNTSVSELRAKAKGTKTSIVEQYAEKWLSELDKIKKIPEYLKPEKTTKAKGGKDTTTPSGEAKPTVARGPLKEDTKASNPRLKGIRSHSRNVRTTLNK